MGFKDETGTQAHGRRRAAVGATAIALIGLLLALGFYLTLRESHSHAQSGGSNEQQSGNGPGVRLADRPSASPIVVSGQKPFVGGETGVCKVPIRDSYSRDDWRDHPVCIHLYNDATTWLVTIRNAGTVPVFLNEEYGPFWHGQTTILPQEAKLMPLWAVAVVRIGACWTGPGGPGTCQAGPAHQVADVQIQGWQDATHLRELWFRDSGKQSIPGSEGPVVATNTSEVPVELNWLLLGRDKWVTIPPSGHTEPIPRGQVVHGRKDFGTGSAARITFASTGGSDDDYLVVTPGSTGPGENRATMTWLGGSWCHVQLRDLGPNAVFLNTFYFPFPLPAPQSGPGLTLKVHESGTLNMKSGTIAIAGQVGFGNPGSFTTLRATNWRKC